MKRIFKLLVVTLLLFPFVKAFAATEAEMEEMRNAVLEITQAYYRKGVNVQYDSYRRNIYFSPEDATPQSYIYTVCSGYPNMVFYQAFGIFSAPYSDYMIKNAKKFKDNIDLVPFYIDGKEEVNSINGIGASEQDIDTVVSRLKSIIKVGDIFAVLTEAGTGHSMIFGENDENGEPFIYESDGKRYSIVTHSENFEYKGSLNKKTLRQVLSRYINYKTPITRVAILRYINSNNEYINRQITADIETYDGLTESAQARLKYPKMDIYKTSNIINDNDNNTRNSVTPGDIIEYKIEIKNNSKQKYDNLVINETIDDNVELIDYKNYTLNENTIVWNVPNIQPGDVATITYRVKVKESNDVLGKYVVSSGYVDKIKNRTIKFFISESLNKSEQKKLLDSYESIKAITSNNDIDFLIELYNKALGIDISFMSNKTFKNYMSHNGCTNINCTVYVKDENVKNITLGNYYNIRLGDASIDDDGNLDEEAENVTDMEIKALYGWYIYKKDDLTTRPRELMQSDFLIGDILIVRNETNGNMIDKAYMYLGNGRLVRRNNILLEYSDGSNGKSTMQALLNSFNEDNYILLRPAMLINRNRAAATEDIKEDAPSTSDPKIEVPKNETVNVADTLRNNYLIIIIFSGLMIISGLILIIKYKIKKSSNE